MDVARSSSSVKSTFAAGFSRAVETLAQAGDGTAEENRAAAMRRFAMLAGAVMIARQPTLIRTRRSCGMQGRLDNGDHGNRATVTGQRGQ